MLALQTGCCAPGCKFNDKLTDNHSRPAKEKKMSAKILLFGKDAWPYTRAAREAFAKEGRQVDYYNVVKEPKNLDTMLKHSNGARKVPVIVEGETVTIGFDGGTWGI